MIQFVLSFRYLPKLRFQLVQDIEIKMKSDATLYLDYQATAPLDPHVSEEMRKYEAESFANPHSADHAAGWYAAKATDEAADAIAGMIGADRDEIIFTSGATEANNLALLGIGRRAAGGVRSRILVSAIEHKSTLAACRALERQSGYAVELLPVDREGFVSPDYLRETIAGDVLILSVMAVNNEIGTIQPVFELSAIAAEHGVLFHCDAAQAPCACPIDQLATAADLVSISGHKMYGPKGIGVLYARRELHERIEPLIYGGGQQNGLRSGTLPVALCVGMAAAARKIGNSWERRVVLALAERFMTGLSNAGVSFTLNGPARERRHPGNLNLRIEDTDAHELLGALQPAVAASMGSACTTGSREPSHVLRAIGLTEREAEASVRFSIGRFTTAEQVNEAACLVADAIMRTAGFESYDRSSA